MLLTIKPLKKVVTIEKLTPFFKKSQKNKPPKKQTESDNEMLLRVAKKFGIFFLVILMFDTFIDLFLGLSDVIVHLIHLGIEVLEYSVEIILEHILHASAHQSEVITANIVLLILLYAAYHLYLLLPSILKRIKRMMRAIGLKYLRRNKCKWRSASSSYKIKWICAHSLGISFLLLFM